MRNGFPTCLAQAPSDPFLLSAFTPVHVSYETGEVFWYWLGDRDFSEPFFRDTVGRAMREHPDRPVLRGPLEDLYRVAEHCPGLTPSGFILHASRCGSTLISRCLGALPSVLVLSEAEPLRVEFCAREHQATMETALGATLSALAQPRSPDQQKLVVKWHHWPILHYDMVCRLIGPVPAVFVYREPGPIVASQLRRPGSWLDPDSPRERWFPGLDGRPLEDMAIEATRLTFEAGLRAAERGVQLLHYRELPQAIESRVAPLFGLALTADDRERLRRQAAYSAKQAQARVYRPEPFIELPNLPEALDTAYQQLETVRLAQLAGS